jgi:hypothetical protein
MPTPVLAVLIVAVVLIGGGYVVHLVRPAVLRRARDCGHRGPARPYTVEAAHDTMQRLIECDVATCHDKASAHRVLVEAKRIRPATQARRPA